MRPDLGRVPSFYHRYIKHVAENDLQAALKAHRVDFINLLKSLPAEKWEYRYAPEKWSIKEMVQHIIDADRIFCYRALRFARKDQTPVEGFDENSYVPASKADRRKPEELLEELEIVQKSTSLLFNSFDEEQLEAAGIANGSSIYVRAIGFIIPGHTLHHMQVIKERYL